MHCSTESPARQDIFQDTDVEVVDISKTKELVHQAEQEHADGGTTVMDAEYHATLICESWRSTVGGIIKTGCLIVAVKSALDHGEFMQMVQDRLPFQKSTAAALMKIGSDVRISNLQRIGSLPPSWGTLSEITRLTDEQFHTALADGTIHADVKRSDITKIINPPEPEVPLDFWDAVERMKNSVCGVIDRTEHDIRKSLGPVLREWADEITEQGGLTK